MRYQVPQFIEIEDKIFGPLTLKQFIYLGGGVGLCLLFFTLLPLYVTAVLAIPVLAFSAALAFYEVNGRPFIVSLEHATKYITSRKLYLWKQRGAIVDNQNPAKTAVTIQAVLGVPKLSQSKLKDLAWSLNIKDTSRSGDTGPEGLAI